MSAYLALGLRLAHDAGRTLLRTWRLHPNDRPAFATKTSSADVVTETDAECERIIVSGIRAAYPTHRFIGEESHHSEGVYDVPTDPDAITWIADPIDGTNNFIHALSGVCISIGVVRGAAEVLVGIVHCPVTNETYWATKNGGAWVSQLAHPSEPAAAPPAAPAAAAAPSAAGATFNGLAAHSATRLRVSKVTDLQRACVATEMGYSRSAPMIELMQAKTGGLLAEGLQSMRMYGTCCMNLCFIAAGKLDAYYEGLSPLVGPKPWDTCAGWLILTEAGGVVLDISGRPFSLWSGRVLAAANTQMAEQVATIINQTTREWSAKYPELADSVAYTPGAGINPQPAGAPAAIRSPIAKL